MGRRVDFSVENTRETQIPNSPIEPENSTVIEPPKNPPLIPPTINPDNRPGIQSEPEEQPTEPETPPEKEPEELDDLTTPEEPEPTTNPTRSNNTSPNELEWAQVRISGENYFFNLIEVKTIRPDLFKPTQFSMFDVLVHLSEQNKIDLDYHFDETMNTHIIDAINGETGWWYNTYYSGGWSEKNVFRPDHYPWKPETVLRFYKDSPSMINEIYSVWKQEIQRIESNNGSIIIPYVRIQGYSFTEEFNDVVVTSHNLRNDTFQENVITAIDVILSLADQGKITYELQWYDSIGTASIVRSYWVDSINKNKAEGRCGFVYEAGAQKYRGFTGNHIHLPSDSRIINSPEYVEYFWICI